LAAEILALADAVVQALNGHAFAAPYAALNARRLYVPVWKLADLGALQVTVVPKAGGGVVMERGGRRDMSYDVDIGFQRKLAAPVDAARTQPDVDALMLLVESVGDFLATLPLTVAGKTLRPAALVNEPIFDPARLDEDAEFLTAWTVSYKTSR